MNENVATFLTNHMSCYQKVFKKAGNVGTISFLVNLTVNNKKGEMLARRK